MQGFEEAQQRYQEQQQTNSEMLNTSRQNAAPQSQPQAPAALAASAVTPAMLLPNQQTFGSLFQQHGNATGNSGQGTFDFNTELKRFQQLQQFSAPAPSNNAFTASNNTFSASNNNAFSAPSNNPFLLPNSNAPSNVQLNQGSVPNQAAFLQSILEQQKLQQNTNFMGGAGINPLLTHPGLLQDARLLLAQSQLGCLLPSQTNTSPEIPLPSPHSLFHRDGSRRMRGGVIEPFPEKLHRLLTEVEAAGRSDVISFVANGRAFAIHKPDTFFKEIVPLYFRQSRLSSFKRQLNLYGFELINTGPSRGGYFHELFVKDRPELCRRMRRVAVKVSTGKADKEEGEDYGQGDEPGKGGRKFENSGDSGH
ncbi:hypothetical protein ACA910_010775 [Epithemia clementina (nom. ined.)]